MGAVAVRCHQLKVPKRDSRPEDCEDFCACAPERGLFAIADGATESAQSGLWAKLLVEEFTRPGDHTNLPAWVAPLQKHWAEHARLPAGGDQPWFVSEMNRHGAFATFLGVMADVRRPGKGEWHAVAVGDSCLFHVRRDELEVHFPLEHSSHLTNTPWLVGSRTSLDGLPAHQRWRSGVWLSGDRLWLMTDALSRWFFEEFEAKRRPWRELEMVVVEQAGRDFPAWVTRQRDERRLKDDDTSLVCLCFP